MAKGQIRGNKEVRKPKKVKSAEAPALARGDLKIGAASPMNTAKKITK